MLRRRLPRRPFLRRPPPGAHPPLPPRIRRALADAHQAMAGGQYGRAADIFGRLADEAHERGAFNAASRMALQAARASLAATRVEAAVQRGKQALRLLVRSGQVGRVPIVSSRMVAALRERGYEAEAEALQLEVEQVLDQAGLSLKEAQVQSGADRVEQHGNLPARCSSCAGPLLPDEVEWHDPRTASCPYCGATVKAA